MYKQIAALWCQCEKCEHGWVAVEIPSRCAKCKSRTWDGGNHQAKPTNAPKVKSGPARATPIEVAKPRKPIEMMSEVEILRAMMKGEI